VNRGRFIVLEGPDRVGKSTQVERLAEVLDAVATREPGGTALGAEVRALLLDHRSDGLDPRAEALLMAADRSLHVAEVVRPALAAGRHVVSDRYLFSSVAYQGAGRGLGEDRVRDLSLWAVGDLVPDLVVLLDAGDDPLTARRPGDGDRLERAGGDFFARVGASYRRQAAADPARWVVVDARADVEVVHRAVLAAVVDRLRITVERS